LHIEGKISGAFIIGPGVSVTIGVGVRTAGCVMLDIGTELFMVDDHSDCGIFDEDCAPYVVNPHKKNIVPTAIKVQTNRADLKRELV